jgi:hypothetical protein
MTIEQGITLSIETSFLLFVLLCAPGTRGGSPLFLKTTLLSFHARRRVALGVDDIAQQQRLPSFLPNTPRYVLRSV